MKDRREYPRTCRLCGGIGWRWDMVKYSTRAYAHFACFAEHKTIADLKALPLYSQRAFDQWRDRNERPGT